jgi:ferritin-like metal-binding protein YciE
MRSARYRALAGWAVRLACRKQLLNETLQEEMNAENC